MEEGKLHSHLLVRRSLRNRICGQIVLIDPLQRYIGKMIFLGFLEIFELASDLQCIRYALKKIMGLFGNFSQHRGGTPPGGLLNSQNFCKLTKCFFACQISFISGGKTEFWEFWGGGHLFPKVNVTKMAKF